MSDLPPDEDSEEYDTYLNIKRDADLENAAKRMEDLNWRDEHPLR